MISLDIARTNVLGVGISAINMPLAMEVMDQWIAARTPNYVCVTGVHGIMECQTDAALRQIHNNAGLVTPDGMPLVWLSQLKGQPHVDRVYGPDLMLEFCRHSVANEYRHFLYGSSDAVLARLQANLHQQIAGINIVGAFSPPFRPLSDDEDQGIVQRINSVAPVVVGVGAAFDFHSGTKRQAPYWMQRSGLEWVFRLITEPKRLWRRYLYNNPRFVWSVYLQMSGLRRYSIQGKANILFCRFLLIG
jgi:N-acetylglucosaminyldiphosphoundecaprenol N-acetyl-beta-D-mannosaminyltransferase